MKITYYVHDLSFPLVEGVRKQAWMLACAMRQQGHQVTILSTSDKARTIIKEGIKIQYGNPFQISNCNTDILHYINHPSPLIVPLLVRAKAKKQIMTMYDGALNGFWKRWWDFIISSLVKTKIDTITLQTTFQRNILQETRLKKMPLLVILPLISSFKRTVKRDKNPTLLFMSHLSKYKGIEETLLAFSTARREVANLRLVICDSKLQKSSYHRLITHLNRGDIIIKEKINPEEELSKAWVYLYPVRNVQETFSVPLSLIEAAQVGTPYISTKVGAISEYFPDEYLVAPRDAAALSQKIIEILAKKKHNIGLKKEINNQKTIKKFLKLYQNNGWRNNGFKK